MPEFDGVKDSGERQQWDTGSQRDSQEGKGRFDLVPFIAIERLAQHFENGAKKYDDDNWKKGQNLRQYINSMMRHAYKMSEGWLDEDHAAAVMWNAAAFIWTKDAIDRGILPAELDDIPWQELESEPGTFEGFADQIVSRIVIPNMQVDTIDLITGGGLVAKGHAEAVDLIAEGLLIDRGPGGPAAEKMPCQSELEPEPVETPVYAEPSAPTPFVDDFSGPQSTGEGLEPDPTACPCGQDHAVQIQAFEERPDEEERRERASDPFRQERAANAAAVEFLSARNPEWDVQGPGTWKQVQNLTDHILSWPLGSLEPADFHNPESDAPK